MVAIRTRKKLHNFWKANPKRFLSVFPWNRGLNEKHRSGFAITKERLSTKSHHADLQQRNILNENNLLNFDTLHDLHVNASVAFSNNPLFGTYTEREGQEPGYEWMKYAEFGDKVTACRSVLKDLGMKTILQC